MRKCYEKLWGDVVELWALELNFLDLLAVFLAVWCSNHKSCAAVTWDVIDGVENLKIHNSFTVTLMPLNVGHCSSKLAVIEFPTMTTDSQFWWQSTPSCFKLFLFFFLLQFSLLCPSIKFHTHLSHSWTENCVMNFLLKYPKKPHTFYAVWIYFLWSGLA